MQSRVLSKLPCDEEFSQNRKKKYFFKAVAEDVVSRANNLEQVSSFLFWLGGHLCHWLFAFLTSLFHFLSGCILSPGLKPCFLFRWFSTALLRAPSEWPSTVTMSRKSWSRNSRMWMWVQITHTLSCKWYDALFLSHDFGSEIYKSFHWDQGLLTRCAVWPTAETSSLSTLPWTLTPVSSAGT